MRFYQPRFLVAAVLIHILLVFALQYGLKNRPAIKLPSVQEISARLIAPEPLPTANIEPPKPKPVIKKEVTPPQPKPVPRSVMPEPATPSERAIEIPTPPSTPTESMEKPSQNVEVKEAPPPPEPVTTQPSHDADYLHNPSPAYPALSKRLNETGKVILKVLVSANGKPLDIKIKKSSGYSRLDDAAINAVRQWLFKPGTSNGKPVDAWYDLPVNFAIE